VTIRCFIFLFSLQFREAIAACRDARRAEKLKMAWIILVVVVVVAAYIYLVARASARTQLDHSLAALLS